MREIREGFGPGATGAFLARNGMVATSSHHATMAGLEVLRAGGNAFHAAAAVQFVLNVAEAYASGIGGGLFMVIYEADSGEVITIDGREEARRLPHNTETGPSTTHFSIADRHRNLISVTSTIEQHFGSVQAVRIGNDGWLFGAADPRREGLAVGY